MNLNQEFNLHSHTTRCGHANGADEDYVLAAIKAGFKEMGFSDHVFLPGLTQPRMRGNYELLDDYLDSVTSLQKKYQNQIKIYKAFEAEWYGPRFEDYYKELLSKGIVDYLILGQHCFFDKQFIFYGRYENRSLGTYLYLNDLLKGMESGLFLYVCHPDLFMAWHGIFDTQAYEVAKAIAKKSKELDIPLEVNMGPSRYAEGGPRGGHLAYPNHRFWEIVADIGAPCVFGVDAHDPSHYQTSDYGFFNEFAAELGLKMVDPRPKMTLIRNKLVSR